MAFRRPHEGEPFVIPNPWDAGATSLSLSVDLENGFGDEPREVIARPGFSLGEIVETGAQRVSVDGSLTWTAVEGMVAAAERIRDHGDFSALQPPARIRAWLADSRE